MRVRGASHAVGSRRVALLSLPRKPSRLLQPDSAEGLDIGMSCAAAAGKGEVPAGGVVPGRANCGPRS
eukprot:10807815-Prorocentrum_lima.AAC.1